MVKPDGKIKDLFYTKNKKGKKKLKKIFLLWLHEDTRRRHEGARRGYQARLTVGQVTRRNSDYSLSVIPYSLPIIPCSPG